MTPQKKIQNLGFFVLNFGFLTIHRGGVGNSHKSFPVAILVFFARTARTRIISSNLWSLIDNRLTWLTLTGVSACGPLHCLLHLRRLVVVLTAMGFHILRSAWLLFCSRTLDLFRVRHWQRHSHENRDGAVVYFINHIIEQGDRLELKDKQRILLFVACILYGVLQLVELTEIFLPSLIYCMEKDEFLEVYEYILCLCLVSSLSGTDI